MNDSEIFRKPKDQLHFKETTSELKGHMSQKYVLQLTEKKKLKLASNGSSWWSVVVVACGMVVGAMVVKKFHV